MVYTLVMEYHKEQGDLSFCLLLELWRLFQVAVDATSNSSATDGKASHPVLEAEPASSETPSAISSSLETAASVFMTDVANLVK